jgi:hypothetical protein
VKRLLLCLSSLGGVLLVAPAACPAEQAPVIRSIAVQGNARTREEVLRRELLFGVGEPLDSGRVAETARNLRGLPFLGRADIRVRAEGGAADVLIEVEDLYARAVTPLLSGRPGELSYGVAALDYNLLGRGQTAEVTLAHDAVTGNRGEVVYGNPRLFGSRHALEAGLQVGSEGHDARLTVSRPFYRLSARWAYAVSFQDLGQRQRRYAGQALVEFYAEQARSAGLYLSRSWGDAVKVRPELRLTLSDRRFTPGPGYPGVPADRRRVLPALGVTVWRPRYETARFLFDLGRTEDVQTGGWLSVRHGVSLRGLGSDRGFGFLQAQVVPAWRPWGRGYAFALGLLRASYGRRGYFNLFAVAGLSVYARVGEAHSLAIRGQWGAVSRSEEGAQLLLGLEEGLRGYPARRFDGTRRALFNLEARPTYLRRRAFVLAGAFFLDGGAAWTPGRTAPAWSAAAGTGLRLGLSRVYNSPILRADLGYGFRDRAWQLGLGLGQYF